MVVQELLTKEASVLAVDENGQSIGSLRLRPVAVAPTNQALHLLPLFSAPQVTHQPCPARPTATWPTAWRSS